MSRDEGIELLRLKEFNEVLVIDKKLTYDATNTIKSKIRGSSQS